MNKTRFRLLVFFMSLSLIGIILVQLYWVNSSLKDSDQQFKYRVQQVLGKVAGKLQQYERDRLWQIYNEFRKKEGRAPSDPRISGGFLEDGAPSFQVHHILRGRSALLLRAVLVTWPREVGLCQ